MNSCVKNKKNFIPKIILTTFTQNYFVGNFLYDWNNFNNMCRLVSLFELERNQFCF